MFLGLSKLKKHSNLIASAFLGGIIAYSIFLIWGMLKPGHDWGGDFALYINQCIHLSSGTTEQLYQSNKFTIQNSLVEVGPFLYPQGFPILLLPIYWLFGLSLFKMKVYCAAFFIASLILCYILFKKQFENIALPIILVAAIAFNNNFIEHCDNVLSDLPFLFFSLVSLLLIKKENALNKQILLGCALFFTYFIRDIGVCLLPALLAYQITNFTHFRKNIFYASIPYLVFSLLFVAAKLWFPNGGENHLAMIFNQSIAQRISENYTYYAEVLSYMFLIDDVQQHVGNKVILLTLIGGLLSLQKTSHYFVYVIFYFIIILIWPSQAGSRFLLPIVPFILLFIGLAFYKTMRFIRVKPWISAIALFLFLYPYLSKTIAKTKDIQTWRVNESYTPAMTEVYSYIKNNIPMDKVIAFEKPRVLSLFSNHRSIVTNAQNFNSSKASYFLISKTSKLGELNLNFKLNHEFEHYLLFSKY